MDFALSSSGAGSVVIFFLGLALGCGAQSLSTALGCGAGLPAMTVDGVVVLMVDPVSVAVLVAEVASESVEVMPVSVEAVVPVVAVVSVVAVLEDPVPSDVDADGSELGAGVRPFPTERVTGMLLA